MEFNSELNDNLLLNHYILCNPYELVMRCVFCGCELEENMRFCMECGKERTAIIEKIKTMPEEISEVVQRINYIIGESTIICDSTDGSGNIIRALGDIQNIDPDFKGRLYATGSISFAPKQTSKMKISFSNRTLQDEPAYRTAIALRREENPTRHIAIYTDVGNYSLHDVGEQEMRTISRNLVIIIAHGSSFYIYGKDIKEGYVKIHDTSVKNNCITELNMNELIRIGTCLTLKV